MFLLNITPFPLSLELSAFDLDTLIWHLIYLSNPLIEVANNIYFSIIIYS